MTAPTSHTSFFLKLSGDGFGLGILSLKPLWDLHRMMRDGERTKDNLAVLLANAVERGWAKEGLCVEHESGNWIANSNTGSAQPAEKTLKTPEVFKVMIVRVLAA